MFRRILIANRGEIAVRIIRACKEMGIETVAVYSTADSSSLHVHLADMAVCIGPAASAQSYLNVQNILSAATRLGCDAIHPGYGFLSENSEFARLVEQCGMVFIGPDADVIDRMGVKAAARELMQKAGVPVVPGSDGLVPDAAAAREIADRIGYPVLIKATAGGGGRGMRRVYAPEELENAFATASAEAQSCFGDGSVYVEKLILDPKHIEFQILADKQGHVVHLAKRECSVQRRNQKMIEESPSRALTPELREKMGQAAVLAAKAAGYHSAGTIEFVLDKDGNFYFIEMNTRIQVEHPVTEMVTGIDLIKEQIRIAAGQELPFTQEEIHLTGHAIECRINAENPREDFRPCPGRIEGLFLPGGMGVRVDSAVYQGYAIPPYYDSMVAKVIVHGDTRLEAIRRMRRALEEFIVEGVDTNTELQYLILHHEEFVRGQFTTSFVERHLSELMR